MRNDSCSRKNKYAGTSHGMASVRLSRGVHLFFAQEFCFNKEEHGPPRGSKQAKTDVLLTTVVRPLRSVGLQSAHTANRSPPPWVTRQGSVRGYRASRPPATRCGAVLYARARAHARADPAKRATQAPPPSDAHGALGTHTQRGRARPPQLQSPPCR